jgi:thiamine biosynthesis lipoprotein
LAPQIARRPPLPFPAPPDLALPAGLARGQFPAMGTVVSLLMPVDRAADGLRAVQAVFAEWEGVLSRFRPESELSYLNQHAGQPTEVGHLLFQVLETALAAAAASDGLYDPTLLRPMAWLGYDRSFEQMDSAPLPAEAAPPAGGWRGVLLDRHRRLVTLPAGVGLDFGGIAKGMAVDAAMARLRLVGIATALVNAGGDLAVAGLPPGADAWPVAVQGFDRAWVIPLSRGAMATSGVARRQWQQGDRQRHHLLDPRTGLPSSSGLWSVSAVAASCGQAEVAAKTAFLLGPQAGRDFLEHGGFAGLLIDDQGHRLVAGAMPLTEQRASS